MLPLMIEHISSTNRSAIKITSRWRRVGDSGSSADDCATAAITTLVGAIQEMNLIPPDSKWMRYSQQDQTPCGHLACRAISD
jgi:hypothetical protein